MNMKLTPREKKLILFVTIIGFVLLSYQYLITPEIKRYQELKKTNQSLVLAYDLATDNGGIAADIERDYVINSKKLNDLTNIKVSPSMTDEALDQYFTDMSLKHGLKPSALLIDHPVQAKAKSEDTAAEKSGEKSYQYIKTVFVTVTATGNYDAFMNMVAQIDGIEYFSIANINSQVTDDGFVHTIKVQVIMLAGDKLEG